MLAHFLVEAAPFPDTPAAVASSATGRAEPAAVDQAAPVPAAEGLQAAPVAAAMASLGMGVAAKSRTPAADTQLPVDKRPARGPMPHDEIALRHYMSDCQDCALNTARSKVVFGGGHVESPDWMVIGEAPGNRDDREGLPFQGKAGQLLQAMLAAIGIRQDAPVFFTNIVKCRPLGNRPPTADEIAACKPYLMRQIEIIQPARILVLGRLAAQVVLGRDDAFDALRGHIHQLHTEQGRDIPVVASYHPASLLMRPQHKIDAWHDLNLAKQLV
ncbi:uracil-DNA glycosylase [Allopusillimonas ginsengisoli]|nr:uracil-DNA glycosylase [Allopusillimonas ginsengisoli]